MPVLSWMDAAVTVFLVGLSVWHGFFVYSSLVILGAGFECVYFNNAKKASGVGQTVVGK